MEFKDEKDRMLFTFLNPILIMIYADMYQYARAVHGVDLIATSTISTYEEDLKLGRTSAAHREARAIDVRTKGLDAFIIDDIIRYINSKPSYEKFHYYSKSGDKRLAYFHIGTAEHIHLAIHARFK